MIPSQVEDVERLDSVLNIAIGIPLGLLEQKVDKSRRSHRPVDLRRDTPFRSISYLEEHRHELPEVVYFVESRRRYPHGRLGAHMLGYVREVRESRLAALRAKGYTIGDLMGQSGIESAYEDTLRGIKGEEYQEVNVSGRVLERHRREPVRGSDIRLGIDLYLQQVAEEALGRTERGAIIAMDPRSGEILAMASRPTFEPSLFSFVVPTDVWRQLNDNTERPMFNRASMGTYPPGSILKMVSAIAALDSGVIDTSTHLTPCAGAMWYGRRIYKCWYGRGHGPLNVVEAIERSCNVFFFQIGQTLGMNRWARTAAIFGLGSRTGIDLLTEETGILASSEVYDRKHGRYRWGLGESLNVAIGQGITLTTPLQMVRYVAALGTGKMVTPHLAVAAIDPDGFERRLDVPEPVPLDVDSSDRQTIVGAMRLVTEGRFGTAHRATAPGFHVAGKTGTAENPHGDSHSWFVGFAPADDPTIAISVICENAGHGSDVAAPAAGEVLRAHLMGPDWLPAARRADVRALQPDKDAIAWR